MSENFTITLSPNEQEWLIDGLRLIRNWLWQNAWNVENIYEKLLGIPQTEVKTV